MRTAKKSKSRARTAFVLTASFGASISGCDGSLVSGEDGSGGASDGVGGGDALIPVGCPPSEPRNGDPCVPGTECEYEDLCSEPIYASCADGSWDVSGSGACNPPAPCPSELPEEITPCWDPAEFNSPHNCQYAVDVACGPQAVVADCISLQDLGEVWLFNVEPCASTATECPTYDSPSLCRADAACRWLAPACDAEEPAPGACYPIDDCTVDSCGPSAVCTPVTYDPCWGIETCGGCFADASVCLPST